MQWSGIQRVGRSPPAPPSPILAALPILFLTRCDPNQAEDQFQTALRAHLQNMDQLIDLQDSRLLALEQEFEVELKTLQKVRHNQESRIVSILVMHLWDHDYWSRLSYRG